MWKVAKPHVSAWWAQGGREGLSFSAAAAKMPMRMASVDLKALFRSEARRHPRLEHQRLLETEAARQAPADALPPFLPFKEGSSYAGSMWVLDWDHRLPSKMVMVRLYAYYTQESRARGEESYRQRREQLSREDLFPEFDVSDFSGLHADEAYEAEMEIGGDPPSKYRLVSPWRRDMEEASARKAEQIARKSPEFERVRSGANDRPLGLGDLEAAEWAAPSESGHGRWGIEVWFLRSFNGMVGEGTAFLVDVREERVVSQREFQFRAG
jgi:hypothetical protein